MSFLSVIGPLVTKALPVVAKALPFVGSLFGGDKKNQVSPGYSVEQVPELTMFQGESGQKLLEFMNKYIDKFIPGEAYAGKLTADITAPERQSLDMLKAFMGTSNIGELFGAGKTQLLDTLAGKYAAPETSPFIQSMTKLSTKNLEDMINAARAQRGGRGSYFTDAAIKEERELQNRTADYLNTIIGDFIEKERGRMFSAAPIAATLDEYEMMTAPLQKITAGQSLGALERTVEQGDLERRYNEFIRQRKEAALPLSAAESLYGKSANFDVPSINMPGVSTSEPSSLQNILNLISKLNWSSLGNQGNIWSKVGGLFG